MSDPDKIVELAVQAAGVADNGWSNRVAALVPQVAAIFREPRDEADPTSLLNIARKVTESQAFTAEYRDHELDDRGRDGNQPTQRIFVRLFDEKADKDSEFLDADGCQTVRTEPMWSVSGRVMRRTLESLVPGQRVVCYRYTEQIDKKRKMGLLIHIQPLAKPPAGGGSHPAPPPAGQERQGRAVDSAAPTPDQAPAQHTSTTAPEPHSPADNKALTEIETRFNRLPAKKKIAFGHLCKGAGITAFMAPEPADLERVLGYLTQIEEQ